MDPEVEDALPSRLGTTELDPEVEDALPLTALLDPKTSYPKTLTPGVAAAEREPGMASSSGCLPERFCMAQQLIRGGLADRLAQKRLADEMADAAPLCGVEANPQVVAERSTRPRKKGNAKCKPAMGTKGS